MRGTTDKVTGRIKQRADEPIGVVRDALDDVAETLRLSQKEK